MINPGQFKTLCSNLSAIVKKQIDVTTKASLGDRNVLDTLNETGQQLGDDMLRVLVMGKFSSGKSTFLNAMMGQKLLPAKPTPTTAVIGEICYGEKPEAILYPKVGAKGGNKPIIIPTTDLPKYIVIDHSESKSDTAKAPNPYKKLVGSVLSILGQESIDNSPLLGSEIDKNAAGTASTPCNQDVLSRGSIVEVGEGHHILINCCR